MEVGQNISTYPKSKKHTYYFVPGKNRKIRVKIYLFGVWLIGFLVHEPREIISFSMSVAFVFSGNAFLL